MKAFQLKNKAGEVGMRVTFEKRGIDKENLDSLDMMDREQVFTEVLSKGVI